MYQYPIRIFIKSSLVFNYKKQNKINIVETPSYNLSIFLQILNDGLFVKKTYDGVLASFSEDQLSLKMEGPVAKINDILQKSIQVAN